MLLIVGAGVIREGCRPLATSIGLAVAIAGAIGLFAGRGDLARGRFAGLDIRWASVPAAACWVGVVLVENGVSHGVAWFVLLLITFWMGLAAGPVVVTLAWVGAVPPSRQSGFGSFTMAAGHRGSAERRSPRAGAFSGTTSSVF